MILQIWCWWLVPSYGGLDDNKTHSPLESSFGILICFYFISISMFFFLQLISIRWGHCFRQENFKNNEWVTRNRILVFVQSFLGDSDKSRPQSKRFSRRPQTITLCIWTQNFWLISFFVFSPHDIICEKKIQKRCDWCKISKFCEMIGASYLNSVKWLVRDTYPYAAIWSVQDTYPNAAIWLLQATYHSTC